MYRTIALTPARRAACGGLLAGWTLAVLLLPVSAAATVGHTVKIRWAEPPVAAQAGEEAAGRIELRAGVPGVVENLTIAGPGWTLNTLEAPPRIFLNSGLRPTVSFRAVPADEKAPLVVRFTFDGRPVEQPLRLDAATLDPNRHGKLDLRAEAPRVVGRPAPGALGGSQTIRFHGRVAYERVDGLLVGADSIIVRIMDDDSPNPIDEEIWIGFTDVQGNFDVTVNWDDCDILGCDFPDVYLQVFTANGPIRVEDFQGDVWVGATPIVNNFSGVDFDFDVITPSPEESPPFHLYTNLVRAHRHAALRGDMIAPPVSVVWPSNITVYDPDDQRIHILESADSWNEGLHTHLFGHHLQWAFSSFDYPDPENAPCDQNGHCMWCPENPAAGWLEGWANWFGSVVNRHSDGAYGVEPLSIDDGRFTAETPGLCQQDMLPYPGGSTEGYVTALLRDIDDAGNDDHDGGAPDCDIDALSIGDDEIFAVFREDDPTNVLEFIEAFRLRFHEHDQDLWSTTRNVTTVFGYPVPPPVVVTQAERCIVRRAGDSFGITAVGNGSKLTYQWRRNGVELFDGGGVTGTNAPTLMFSPAPGHMSGTYSCRVSTCDQSLSAISLPVHVAITETTTPQPLLSWGENRLGQAGTGNVDWPIAPGVRALTDVLEVEGGARHTAGLRNDGTVWTWGTPGFSVELGNGFSSATVTTPTQVADFDSVTQIAVGDEYTLALRLDGTIWGWGWNGFGNLGDSTQVSPPRPTLAKEVVGCVKAISCGSAHSLALLEDGRVLAWGYNEFGQLGRGTTGGWSVDPQPVTGLEGVIAISAKTWGNLALKSDGTVWAWGWNQNGGLGIGSTTTTPIPTQVVGLTDVRYIGKGHDTGFAIRNDGTAWSWGSNANSLLGNGQSVSQVTHQTVPGLMPGLVNPVMIDATYGGFGVALMPNGTVRMWGYNDTHAFGAPTPTVVPMPWVIPGVGGVANLGTGPRTVFAFGALVEDVAATPDAALPAVLALRASPNPSFARTRVAFDLPAAGPVSLAVYDVAGRQIRSLVDGSREAGRHVEDWDGRGSNGAASLAGVYFVRLVAGGRTLSERVVRMR